MVRTFPGAGSSGSAFDVLGPPGNAVTLGMLNFRASRGSEQNVQIPAGVPKAWRVATFASWR
jgi:hypothetical protein